MTSEPRMTTELYQFNVEFDLNPIWNCWCMIGNHFLVIHLQVSAPHGFFQFTMKTTKTDIPEFLQNIFVGVLLSKLLIILHLFPTKKSGSWGFTLPSRSVHGHSWSFASHSRSFGHMLHGAGIFTNIGPKNHANVGKCIVHGAWCGYDITIINQPPVISIDSWSKPFPVMGGLSTQIYGKWKGGHQHHPRDATRQCASSSSSNGQRSAAGFVASRCSKRRRQAFRCMSWKVTRNHGDIRDTPNIKVSRVYIYIQFE